MTDECKSLQVSDWCFSKRRWIRAHHAHPLVPAAEHPASTRQPQSHFPQAFPKPGPEVEEGALLYPTSPLSTLTCGWELNQGYPLPEWVGYWKMLKNWPSLAQLQISHQSSAPVFDLLGAIKGSTWNLLYALQRSKLDIPHGTKQISSEETVLSRRKFVCCFF